MEKRSEPWLRRLPRLRLWVLMLVACSGCTTYRLAPGVGHRAFSSSRSEPVRVVEDGTVLELRGISIAYGFGPLGLDAFFLEPCRQGQEEGDQHSPLCWPGEELASRRLLAKIVEHTPAFRRDTTLARVARSLPDRWPEHNRIIIGTRPVVVALVPSTAGPLQSPWLHIAVDRLLSLRSSELLVFPVEDDRAWAPRLEGIYIRLHQAMTLEEIMRVLTSADELAEATAERLEVSARREDDLQL